MHDLAQPILTDWKAALATARSAWNTRRQSFQPAAPRWADARARLLPAFQAVTREAAVLAMVVMIQARSAAAAAVEAASSAGTGAWHAIAWISAVIVLGILCYSMLLFAVAGVAIRAAARTLWGAVSRPALLFRAAWRLALFTAFACTLAVAGTAGLIAYYAYTAVGGAPPPAKLLMENGRGIHIVDRHGQRIFDFPSADGGFRTPVSLDQISPYLIQATIAIEDSEFWEHGGLNLKGIARAAYENLAYWEYGGFWKGTGGSSITQQLAKNLYIPQEQWADRDLHRKAVEAVLAYRLSHQYSKEELLKDYFNVVFYGNSAYGAEAAAQRYFDKHAAELNLAEASLLAGLPKAPTDFEPLNHFEAARDRQRQVLDRMVQLGYIDQAEADVAWNTELHFSDGKQEIHAPHFAMYVRDLLPQILGQDEATGSLRVTTTLDLGLQEGAQQIVAEHAAQLERSVRASDAALVALDPGTGEILAMVGSRDWFDNQVNNALALNNPGSSIKPIVYLEAFLKGWNPATIVQDSPMSINDNGRSYALADADNRWRGPVTVRRALANSLNPPAVQAIQHGGVADTVALARRMGLTAVDPKKGYGVAFALGGLDATLLDMTYAYSVLAAGGEEHGITPPVERAEGSRPLDPIAILKVEDSYGHVLYEAKPQAERIVPAPYTYLITSILTDNNARVEMFGPNSPIQLPDRTAAAKTGTTDDFHDVWTIGYTPHLVAGVWVGNDNNDPIAEGALSSRTAGPVWHDFMEFALKDTPPEEFPVPDGVAIMGTCVRPQEPPDRGCAQTRNEYFVAGQTQRQAPAARTAAAVGMRNRP